ncbi:MAG TPA: hypothetical protein VF150_04345, partial [Thermoanaerobaculia bacterium]
MQHRARKPFGPARAAAALVLSLSLAVPAAAGAATATADHPATFATDWLNLIVERVKAEGYSPLVASRIYAYSGVTLYQAVLPGMPDHQTLAGQLHDLPALPQPPADAELDWPAAASAALAGLA